MTIKTENSHNLSTNDRIILQNAKINTFNLKGGISLKNNSNYIKITHNHHNITIDEVKNNFLYFIVRC